MLLVEELGNPDLPVAHGIISANGGDIEFTSDEGTGTTFTRGSH